MGFWIMFKPPTPRLIYRALSDPPSLLGIKDHRLDVQRQVIPEEVDEASQAVSHTDPHVRI